MICPLVFFYPIYAAAMQMSKFVELYSLLHIDFYVIKIYNY